VDVAGPATPIPADSIAPRLVARFALAPARLDVWQGRRISLGFSGAPWASMSDDARFARAYDIARWLWEGYGVQHGIDTISVLLMLRMPNQPAGSAPGHQQEFFFYPQQLAAGERPHLGSVR
jgi:hypothetical protein